MFVGFGKNSVIAQLIGSGRTSFGIALVSPGMQYLVTWETMLGIFRFLLSTFTIKVAKTKVLNENDLTFNRKEYQSYSNLCTTATLPLMVGFEFVGITGIITHFVVFHARYTMALIGTMLDFSTDLIPICISALKGSINLIR